ncbi:MAG: tetratricopeptide repeat protein [candidate division WOR-3 bacterium]|nr:tetratricopeptide repeat protein [candidate division WOR-3 bacterium]
MKLSNLLLILIFFSCSQKNVHIKNARKFISQWNYDRALIEILKYREDKDSEVQYLLGVCYLGKNEYDQAKEHFKNSLNIDTFFRDSILNLYTNSAKRAMKISDLEKALQFYKALADLLPDYQQADNLFLVANLNFQQGDYYNALLGYLRAYQIDSVSEMARRSMGNFLKSLIECDSLQAARRIAIKEYKRAKTTDNLLMLGEINYLIGKEYFDKKEYDSALVYFNEMAASQEPKSLLDDVYFYIAEIFYAGENYSDALEYYKKVLRLNPYQKGELAQKSQLRIKEIKEKR